MKLRYGRTYREHVISVLKEFSTLIIYDTETTGLSPLKNHIVQFSAQKYRILNGTEDVTFEKIAEFSQYINPASPMEDEASKITGLTNEFLSQYPKEEDVFPEILKFLTADKSILCGYNVSFDDRMLHAMMQRYGYQLKTSNTERKIDDIPSVILEFPTIDVFSMAKELISAEKCRDKSRKLANCCEAVGIIGDNFHNADADIEMTFLLFEKLLPKYQEQLTKTKERASIISISRWNGPNHKLQRVYVDMNTSKGRRKAFYDIYQSQWVADKSNKDLLLEIDINQMEIDVLSLLKLDSVQELSKYEGRYIA